MASLSSPRSLFTNHRHALRRSQGVPPTADLGMARATEPTVVERAGGRRDSRVPEGRSKRSRTGLGGRPAGKEVVTEPPRSPQSSSSSTAPARRGRSMDEYWRNFTSGEEATGGFNFTGLSNTYIQGIDVNCTDATENHVTPPAVDGIPHILPEATTDDRGKRKVTTRKLSRGASNFSSKEDEMICAAYLNVSKDPIIGIGQASARYWKRIHDYFHTHKTFESDRTQVAIQHRWGIIQKETSRFCGFKSMIDRRNESGKTEDDRIRDALKAFEDMVGHPFQMYHCWLILRHQRKWNHQTSAKPTATASVDNSGPEAVQDNNNPLNHPIGRDAAKKKRSQGDMASSSSSACLEVLQKLSTTREVVEQRREGHMEELLAREDKKLALKEREIAVRERQANVQEQQLLAMQRIEEARIMSIDVDKVTDWQQDYYISLQKDIVNKRLARASDDN